VKVVFCILFVKFICLFEMFTYLCDIKLLNIMEQSKKSANRNSVIFALIHGATYLPAVWLLKHRVLGQPVAVIIAIVPIITFAIFIFKLIKAFSVMDEVKQRVQLEAVVIGFSLTAMLLMILFLLDLCDISNHAWFGFGYLVCYCWLFYFIGWFISKKKYGV
jgi:hypothetical protein